MQNALDEELECARFAWRQSLPNLLVLLLEDFEDVLERADYAASYLKYSLMSVSCLPPER